MRTKGLAGLIAGLVLAVGVVGADAHRAKAPTTLELVTFADSNGNASSDYILGTVSSPKQKCVGRRTVKITRRTGVPKLIDSTRTSKNGYWAGGGVEGINSIEGKVTVLGSSECKPASENFD